MPVSLGSLGFGMSLGWSSSVQPQLVASAPSADQLTLSAEDWSWVASLVQLGSLAGALAAGRLIDFAGRKTGLLLTTLPFILGWLLIITAHNSGMAARNR